jgi:hypothetical protein
MEDDMSYIHKSYITDCGVKLGNWVEKQRVYKRKDKLSQEQIDLLEKIPGWFGIKNPKKPTKDMPKSEIKPKKTPMVIRNGNVVMCQSNSN